MIALHLFQCVIETGALAAFLTLLRHQKSNIQKESAWAISNITAGNTKQIQSVIDANIMPHVIELMCSVSTININMC